MNRKHALALIYVTSTSALMAQDLSAVYYGSPSWHPQTVAQERANHMARSGLFQHLGTGHVATSMGQLSEGIGWGQNQIPETCVATNGTAAIADATANDGRGNYYRVRLYNSPGTMNPGQQQVTYTYGYNYAGYGNYYAGQPYYRTSYNTAAPAVRYRR